MDKFFNGISENDFANKIAYIMFLQNEMNEAVNPDWIGAEYNFKYAAIAEINEAIDGHFNWKWWAKKKIERNNHQLFLENVDILHFFLSDFICHLYNKYSSNEIPIKNKEIIQIYSCLFEDISENDLLETYYKLLYNVVSNMGNNDTIMTDNFTTLFKIINSLGYDFNDICKYYVAKNVLNRFRQEKGYAKGSYKRNWGENKLGCKDDNDVLETIIKEYDNNSKEIVMIDRYDLGELFRKFYERLNNLYNFCEFR